MNFKSIKLICIALLLVIIVVVPNESLAFKEMLDISEKFEEAGEGGDPIIDETKLQEVSNFVFRTLLMVAIVIAIIWGAFIGLQLMMQGAEGKAQMKEALIPYVIGCTVAFSAFGIWKVVVDTLQSTSL